MNSKVGAVMLARRMEETEGEHAYDIIHALSNEMRATPLSIGDFTPREKGQHLQPNVPKLKVA